MSDVVLNDVTPGSVHRQHCLHQCRRLFFPIVSMHEKSVCALPASLSLTVPMPMPMLVLVPVSVSFVHNVIATSSGLELSPLRESVSLPSSPKMAGVRVRTRRIRQFLATVTNFLPPSLPPPHCSVDQLQIFAIIWIASCPAAKDRFPTQWCNSISWSPYLNLDILGKTSWEAKALQAGNATEAQLQAQLTLQEQEVAGAVLPLDTSSSLWILCAPSIATLATWIYFLLGSAHVKYALGARSRFVPTLERLVIRLGVLAPHSHSRAPHPR